MYEPLKFTHNGDQKVFGLSDPHLGHAKDFIINPRGFSTSEDHDSSFKEKWNEKVGPNDVVHMLGDMIFGQNADFRLLELFKELNFKELYMSPGNHFSGWRQLYQHAKTKIFNVPKDVCVYPLRVELKRMFGDQYPEGKTVIFMPNYYEMYVNGQFIVCSHYPVASWNCNGKGAWMLSGHVHGRFHGSHKDTTDEGKILDLGPESIGQAPLSFDEIAAIMDTKSVKVVDHHGVDTNYPV